tara:strand:- start:2037 stop:2300 length:264 start_codon:yes stop_codon:yes gene_type:complete
MTKIYIYCLFEGGDVLHGVYSSIKAAHRDALKLANSDARGVYINHDDKMVIPNLKLVKNIFAGEFDVKLNYFSETKMVSVLKTKLKE